MQDIAQLTAAILAYAYLWPVVGVTLLIVFLQTRSAKHLIGRLLIKWFAAKYDSPEMQRNRARLANCLLANEKTIELDHGLLLHFELVASLLRRELLDQSLVSNVYGHDLPRYWMAVRHFVEATRQQDSDLTLYEGFETLAKQFQRLKQSPLGTGFGQQELSSDDIREFLRRESRKGAAQQPRHAA